MQYYRDELALNTAGNIIGFPLIIIVLCLNLKKKMTAETGSDGLKDIKIMMQSKYSSKFLQNP